MRRTRRLRKAPEGAEEDATSLEPRKSPEGVEDPEDLSPPDVIVGMEVKKVFALRFNEDGFPRAPRLSAFY